MRLADDGVFAPAFTEGAFHARGTPAEGLFVDSATVSPAVSVEVDASAPASYNNVTVRIELFAGDGATRLATSTSAPTPARRGATTPVAPPPLTIANAELWSIGRPYLHVLVASLLDGAGGVLDTKNVTVGVRSVRWDAINGAFLNEQQVKLRGFCNHNNFAGVGMGVPPRVNLLRLQQIRGMGGNSWREFRQPFPPYNHAPTAEPTPYHPLNPNHRYVS
jgi:beta-galactosidase/beta-glucuronidase